MSKRLQHFLHCCFLLIFIASLALAQPSLAASPTAAPQPQEDKPRPDKIRFGHNTRTGKLSFVGSGRGEPLIKIGAVGAQSAEAAGMTVIRRYAAQFGVQDPARNIRLERVQQEASGTTLRYQQQYRGVPVVGGEMVVNTDADGNVLSLNGEVSPDLTMASVTPTITAEQARQIALQGMQEWHAIAPEGAETTEPELWLYDERIFHESTKPVALVWRLEVTPVDFTAPVHEFVLVDARTGEIALHFNQVDTSWHHQEEEPTPTSTPEPAPTETPAPEPAPTEVPTAEPTPTFMPTEMPAPEPTPTEMPTELPTAEPQEQLDEFGTDSGDEASTDSGVVLFVMTNGTDSGDCGTPITACKTLSYAIGKSSSGALIKMSGGLYNVTITQNIFIDNLHISGGWNSSFTAQDKETEYRGLSYISGFNIRSTGVQISNLKITKFDTGVLVNSSRSATIHNSLLISNSYAFSNSGTLAINSCAVIENWVGVTNSGSATITNSTFSSQYGYGIFNSGSVSVTNSTLVHNTQTAINTSSSGSTTLSSNIFAGNGTNCSGIGSPKSDGFNLFQSSCGTLISKPTDRFGVDPKIGPLVNNKYYPLLVGSPAIDIVADPAIYCPSNDIRGAARPANSYCDAGSYEYTNPGAPAVIQSFSGNFQVSGTNRRFRSPLTVLVLDDIGSPVPGSAVHFRTPAEGPSATFNKTGSNQTTVTTGIDGTATSSLLTANNIRGALTVQLTISDQVSNYFNLYVIDLFVNPNGSDTDNDCMNIALPCKTVNHVFSKAMSGASIYFSIGEYKVVGVIEIRADDLFISGGWNDSYTSQNQKTVLYGDGLGNLAIIGKNTEITNLVFTNLSDGINVYSDGELLLRNSALTNSYVGIRNSGNTTLINTTISGNREYGIRASGFLTITNSTIAFNGGDAILNNTPNLTFQNSIISQNKGSCYGNKIKSKGYNIVEHPCSKLFNLSSTDKDSVNPNLSQIVQGSHHALLPGSPAIDAIPLTSSSNCPAVDIRGINRPVGSKCDIGAYEYKSVGDPNDLIIFSGNSQITGPNRKFKEPLRVQVVDSFGTPVKGISVHFNAPSDGASGIFGKTGTSTATVITDVSGIATAGYLTANWISGEYHIDAAIQNGNQKVTFTFTNRALFVSLSGTDQNNNCTSQLEPCRSLAYTLSKSVPGYSIFIEQGKYVGQNSVLINVDDIHILGGWNPTFTAQTGQTNFEGKQSSGTFELRSKNIFISNVILTNFSIGLDVRSYSTAAVENSAFTGNGTGIQNGGNLSLVNVTVSENINGITNSGPLTINNATIVNNTWYGLIQQYQYQYAMQIRNSIVANNAENCDIFSNNTIKSLGYNIFDKKCGDGFKSSSTDKYSVNPHLSSLLLNSFHALLPNSPAINAIPKTAYCPSNDIRGLSRPIEDKCDIGAYEYTTPGVPSQLLPFPYDTIITGTNLPSSSPLNVLVLDSSNAPVPGVSVKFSSPTTGPGGTFKHSGTHTITIVTNSSGIAYAGPYIANHEVGKYTVVISAEAYQLSSIFSIEHLNLYISPTGTNTSNNCQIASSPCQTLAYAFSIAAPGVSILVSEGTYNISSEITVGVNNVYISGGWDPTFSLQNKRTLFRGSSNLLLVKSKGISFDHIIFSDANNAVVIGPRADLTILNSSFTNNTTGIDNHGKLTLINTTISTNRGTGIRNSSKTYLINTTMVNNKTNAIYQTNAYAIVYLQNSIIAPGQNCNNAGTLISNGFNLLAGVCAHQTITKITDQIGIDPGLSILINQSYHALQSESPAIDAIKRNAPGAYCPERDTRGVTRQLNAPCDIGAYEFTVPGQPVQNQIVQGANQKIGPLQAPIMPLQVLVLDQIGSPVPGVIVTFTAPASGASGTFGTSYTSAITTDPGGVASQSYFRANKIQGSYTVTASVLGIAGNLSFALENGGSIYVNATTGNDGTDCRSVDQPCRTISRAYTAATSWDAIYLASGEYTNSQITIEKHLFISGGWNNDFTSQINYSTLVGSTISISQGYDFSQAYTLSLDRINTRGLRFVNNIKGSLRITNGSITGACNAIYNLGTLELVNATISNNTCFPSDSTTVKGAGIYNKGGYARLVNVTITRNHLFYAKTTSSNTMNNAGGIFVYDGLVVLKNSILSNNRSNSGFDCYGPIHSLGNNIVGNASGCVINTAPGDLIGSLAEPVSAHLAELVTENTSFHALLSGSPAIDSGDPTACPSHDQRGQIRPAGSSCDIGAYEGAIVGVPTPFAITFSSNSYEAYPGSYRCMSPSINCDASEEDANLAHAYGLAFLQFIMDKHGRNGIDGAGTPLISSVRYKSNYQNAFWADFGFQIVYGNGYPKADDIVAHEITHGITQTTSSLFYYYQSGAINESLSDLWGEYFDQENGIGNDSDSVKWLIGEGLPSGSIRNMKNPPAFRDPDRMTSVHYYKGSNDNGGVHWNSGVNNKAIYLMVDGGTFNNRTVRPLGWEKTAAVYYYAQTRLLTSASDYLDLYHALSQACSALINGKEGINESDCKQVRNAADAVEMSKSPDSGYNPEAAFCPNGTTKFPTDLFMDDFENGFYNWSSQAKIGNPRWGLATGYATSGRTSMYGADYDPTVTFWEQKSDSSAAMLNTITVPSNVTTMLHFNHSYGFSWGETGTTKYYFDGGILEYTIDDGSTWKDAKGLFSAGKNYNGTLYNGSYFGYNPLGGRATFAGESRGYVSSRYNLTSLAGKSVRFRWRMGTDEAYDFFGWVVDDVRIYKCIGNPAVPALLTPSNGNLITNYQPRLDWKNASNAFRYELVVARDSAFTDVFFTGDSLTDSEYTFTSDLPYNTRFYWRVRTINELDIASSWSPTWSFRTALLPTGNLAPTSGAIPDSLRPTFEWNESSGASAYNLIVSTYSNYSNPLVNVTLKGTSFTPTQNLPANKTLYWRVRATGTNPSAWSRDTFTTPRPAPAPSLASPGNGARIYNYTPALKWKASVPPLGSPPLAYYHLQVSDNNAFTSTLLYDEKLDCTDTGCTTFFDIPAPLAHNTRFYWRVRAVNTAGQFAWWSSRSFRTALFPPEITAPAVDVVPDSLRPTFEWGSSPDATSYTLVVSTYANYSSPLVNQTTSDTRYIPTRNLPANKKLYWRVRANGANPSAWASSTFTTPNPLPAPALVSPVNASRLTAYDPAAMLELKWKPSTASTFAYYHVQFNDSLDFAAPMYENKNSLSPSFELPPGLQPDRQYFWRVKTVNSSDQFAWWSSAFFIIPIPAPELLSPAAGQAIPDTRPAFDWTDVEGAVSYTIVISTYANFSSPLINTKVTGSEYTATKVLPRGRIIYWRVRANGANGAGVWSQKQTFKVQ